MSTNQKTILDPLVLMNYFPVSNVLFLGKVIRRALVMQLQALLDVASVLSPFQYDFHPRHGMETVLVSLMDDLQRQLDGGRSALLDLMALFKMVNHDLLVYCLVDVGIWVLTVACLLSSWSKMALRREVVSVAPV